MLNRAPARMDVYADVASTYSRTPLLSPIPGNATRWNSRHGETGRDRLLDEGRDDYHHLLTAEEKRTGDTSRLMYTSDDKEVPCISLCLLRRTVKELIPIFTAHSNSSSSSRV